MKHFSIIAHILLVVTIVASGWLVNTLVVEQVLAKPLENFTYGIALKQEEIPKAINLVSGPWVGSRWSQENEKWLAQFKDNNLAGQVPYLNLYTIAGLASAKKNLKDCNVGAQDDKTLCVAGADFIRQYEAEILKSYTETAVAIKNNYGSEKIILLHFEPDFYQYNSDLQNGGGLSFGELAELINSYTDIFKQQLPKAQLVMDVSAWNPDLKDWSTRLRNFDYVGLVGKRFDPDPEIKNSKGIVLKTYRQIAQETGKKIIVNDAHGAGGKWLDYNQKWEDQELIKARFADGVVAVIQSPLDTMSLIKMTANNKIGN